MKYRVSVDGVEHEVVVEGNVVRVDGESHGARLTEIPGSSVCLLSVDHRNVLCAVYPGAERGQYRISIDGYRIEAEALDERTRALRALDVASRSPAGPAVVVAPMPGLIVRVQVKEGETVEAGQGVVVMEAMKMENELRSPSAGVVGRVHVAPGMAVEKGTALLEMAAGAQPSD